MLSRSLAGSDLIQSTSGSSSFATGRLTSKTFGSFSLKTSDAPPAPSTNA